MTAVVRAGALLGFDDLVRGLGADPAAVLAEHGVGDIGDPERLVPLDAVAAMFEHCAAVLAAPDLGLRVGLAQGPWVLGAVAAVATPGRSIAEVVRDLTRYLFLHSPAYEVTLDPTSPFLDGGETVRFAVVVDEATPTRQLVEGCLASAVRAIELLTGDDSGLRGVSLPHSPAASTRRYRRAFGVTPTFEQPYAGLHFRAGATAREVVDLPGVREIVRARPPARGRRWPGADHDRPRAWPPVPPARRRRRRPRRRGCLARSAPAHAPAPARGRGHDVRPPP